MYRNYMAWFPPTGTALFATVILTIPMYLAVIDFSMAQSSDSQQSDRGWNIKPDPKPGLVAQQTNVSLDSATETKSVSENVIAAETPMDEVDADTNGLAETELADDSVQQTAVSATDAPLTNVQVGSETDNPIETLQDAESAAEINLLTPEQQAQADAIATQQLNLDLKQQLEQLQLSLETEYAFSSKLGEDYFGYGKLLREAGQIEESIEALTSALHIAKVNNGIYSIEQRPVLYELFDIHYNLANTEDFEDYLEKILWVENKNSEFSDNLTYELLLKVGNRYIDQFLRRPVAGQASVELLLRAKHHLITAFRAYSKRPLSEMLMPYGELALISFLESKVQPNVDKTASLEDSRLRGVGTLTGRELTLASYFEDPFPKGEAFLQIYLRKAQREGSAEHVVRALISLGDLNQLFGRYSNAGRYYELAWLASQELAPNQPSVVSFDRPTLLPDFTYAYPRENIPSNRKTVPVSLTLIIGSDGRVKDVQRADPDDGLEKYFSKARRAVKRLVFRPQFVDAKAVVTEQFAHTTKVRLKR